MPKRLTENITSQYIRAANSLTSEKARTKIIAYVESYDDVYFWRQILSRFEDDTRYFEIMLPTKDRFLDRGKKAAISNMLRGLGDHMIACVDADYDYLLQGQTANSQMMLNTPYIFHTYVYAIENYQCYAPGLHDACVMITLNDHHIFDFEDYLESFSRIIYPLFLWNIWMAGSSYFNQFTQSDFNNIIHTSSFSIRRKEESLGRLNDKVQSACRRLSHKYKEFTDEEKDKLSKRLASLGVVPENTYLYIQGHHLFNKLAAPMVRKVCDILQQERTSEIRRMSIHAAQCQTEYTCYENSIEPVRSMLKKNTYYQNSSQYQHILSDIGNYLRAMDAAR